MNSATAAKPVHKSWLFTAAKVVVVLQSLTIVYALTSVWTTLAFAVVVVTVKALRRASKQVDRIFEEEPG